MHLRAVLALLLPLLSTQAVGAANQRGTEAALMPENALAGMQWRLVGPHRAGWGTTVVGIADQPDTYYFGAAGGGIWKTDNSGRTWQPIFDHGPASIGALAIAASNPKVLYAGTGQVSSRYDIAAGEGVFKSMDGGKSWAASGLADTRHIGAIWVDPRNADRVLVAALGHAFGSNTERGVFASVDGGKSWQKTLFVDADTGAVDIAVDPQDSNVVFASVWQMRYRPWMSYFTPDYDDRSGIYKSIDGGLHWARLSGGGWPEGKLGRIGVAATHTAHGTRVYAIVDAESAGGLYRSDDGGAHWLHVNDDAELVNGYFSRIVVMPGDADTVFAMGRSIHKCTAGGTHCEITKGSPGGDDYHDLWINPLHPERMITGSDQGTVVSVDNGATWSSWYNQPTGQLYHLATDNRFPYWIYAGQQDNGTVAIASRTDYGAITSRDWHPVGADERDYDIPDPVDPDIVYGSGLGGRLSRWNARNGEVQNVSPWPVSTYGSRPTSVRYHYTWITPIAISSLPPYPIYQGAQVLFRSNDHGANWAVISPEVSPRDPSRKDCDADQAPEGALACGYGVIFSIGLSPRSNQEIWLGSEDGRVLLTRDAGATWQTVTPPGVSAWSKISTVDVSPLEAGTAYIAVDNHRADDFRPMAWRTHDFGKTWTLIDGGLPAGHFVGALRADTVKRGLLYAGTDQGVFASFDDGDHWQSLQRNLPSAIVTDLLVHGDDLIAATQGRSIWVLDQLSPLRQIDGTTLRQPAHLFTPGVAIRVRGNQNKDTPLPREEPTGRNPADGAVIDYWLSRDARAPVTLQITDAAGKIVRRFSSDALPEKLPAEPYFESRWLGAPQKLSASAGAHRFVWNLRGARPVAGGYDYSIAATDGDEATFLPQGMLMAPGAYQAVLRIDGRDYRAPLTIAADPRVKVDPAALAGALALSAKIVPDMQRQFVANGQVDSVVKQIKALTENQPKAKDAPVSAALAALSASLAPLTQGEEEKAPLKLATIGGQLTSLQGDLESSDAAPTGPQQAVYAEYSARLAKALAVWAGVQGHELAQANSQLRAAGLSAIVVPAANQLPVAKDPGVSREMP